MGGTPDASCPPPAEGPPGTRGRRRTSASLKTLIKSGSGTAIRLLSHLLPNAGLLRTFLLLRRLYVLLARVGVPTILLKAFDHLFYSLRPAEMEARLGARPFWIRLNDPFHYDLLLGVHEPEVREWLTRNVAPGMTVCDVGANVGFYALLLADRVGPEGRVVALEANSAVAELLEKNLRANRTPQVVVVRAAAYRRCGEVWLGVATASTGYSGLHYERAAQWVRVPALTLDAVATQLGLERVHVVKVDVEGAEADVLEGMRDLLHRHRPVLVVELHSSFERETQQVLHRLREAGYALERLTPEHLVARPQELSGAPSARGLP